MEHACPACGAPVTDGAPNCDVCRATLRWEGDGPLLVQEPRPRSVLTTVVVVIVVALMVYLLLLR